MKITCKRELTESQKVRIKLIFIYMYIHGKKLIDKERKLMNQS